MQGPEKIVLIYSADQPLAIRLSSFCRQLGLLDRHARTNAEAEEFLRHERVQLIILDLELDMLSVPCGVPRIAFARGAASEHERLVIYQPQVVLDLSCPDALLISNLSRVAALKDGVASLPCILADWAAGLQGAMIGLRALLRDKEYRRTGRDFVSQYCFLHCACSMPASMLTGEQIQEYNPLPARPGQAALVCRFKKNCALGRFQDYLERELPGQRGIPTDILEGPLDGERPLTVREVIVDIKAQIEKLLQEMIAVRNKFCAEECRGRCSAFSAEDTDREPCSHGRCVLQDCFRIIPQKELLPERKALLFENSARDIEVIAGICREFNLVPVVTTDPVAAERILADGAVILAFINPALGMIRLPAGVGAVILDDGSMGIVATMVAYRAVKIVQKPLSIEALSLGMTRGLGVIFRPVSFFAALNNIFMLLHRWDSSLFDCLSQAAGITPLAGSIKFFCEENCGYSVGKEAVLDGDFDRYRLLNPFSSRGARYCERRRDCRLWRFLDSSEGRYNKLSCETPQEFCRQSIEMPEEATRMDALGVFVERVTRQVLEWDCCRLNFCINVCENCRKDIDIARKDIIFSSFSRAIDSNCFVYCREHGCPLMAFFEYFRKTVV